MSKEELLKCLIVEIDLIMHDKNYRFENADGTWYSRESCRDLTNEEVFEELKTELRQIADLEAKLTENEKKYQEYRKSVEKDIEKEITERMRDTIKEFNLDISGLKQQLAEKDHEIENYQHELEVYKHNDNIYSSNIIKMNNNAKRNKIDFAVKQLEKVKELFGTKCGYCAETDLCWDIEQYIDNQIKQLKEK